MRNRGRDNNKKNYSWQAGVPSIEVQRAPFMRMRRVLRLVCSVR
jgi:hypothetical protein